MPYLALKIAAPAARPAMPQLSGQVAALLTDLTAKVLGKKRELTAVALEFVDPQEWFIGGQALPPHLATFYLDIKVTEGTNTKNEKADYVQQVFAGMTALLGELAPASYIVIDEVHADAWGYQGRTQEFRYIQGKAL